MEKIITIDDIYRYISEYYRPYSILDLNEINFAVISSIFQLTNMIESDDDYFFVNNPFFIGAKGNIRYFIDIINNKFLFQKATAAIEFINSINKTNSINKSIHPVLISHIGKNKYNISADDFLEDLFIQIKDSLNTTKSDHTVQEIITILSNYYDYKHEVKGSIKYSIFKSNISNCDEKYWIAKLYTEKENDSVNFYYLIEYPKAISSLFENHILSTAESSKIINKVIEEKEKAIKRLITKETRFIESITKITKNLS